MIARRAGHALEDLDRVARDTTADAVMEGTAESRLAATVRVELDVKFILQALFMVELGAGTDNALFDAFHRTIV